MQFRRDMDRRVAYRFVGMYINDLTLDYGERDRAAVRRLLALGHQRGITPHRVYPEFIE